MNDFLPSRKVVAYLVVPIITLFALWAISSYEPKPKSQTEDETPLSSIEQALAKSQAEYQSKDTDGDGLKDWEEVLYQTNPLEKDTDKDGLFDGAEVKKGQDPLIPNVDTDQDTSEEQITENAIAFYRDDPDLNRTDILARDLFVGFTDLNKAGAVGSEGIQTGVIDKIIDDNSDTDSVIRYTTEDITIIENETPQAIAAYTAAYIEASQVLVGISFNDLELLARYLEDEDQAAIPEMKKNQKLYKSFSENLMKVSVPKSISLVHVELANNMAILSDSIAAMTTVVDDPLTALVYAQKYVKDEEILDKNIDAMSLFFANN